MIPSLLVSTFANPNQISQFSTNQWNTFLSQARVSFVLYRAYLLFKQHNLLTQVPERIIPHLKNDSVYINNLVQQLESEVATVSQQMTKKQCSPIFLKGAAYVINELELAKSRVFSDIDILVTKSELAKAENALKRIGFTSQKTDDYDQKYYREYMHEIPPMQHIIRGTVLDVHHNILPVCKGVPVNINQLAELAVEVKFAGTKVKTFSPVGLFIHCAVHLFHEGEFEKGFRDLTDLALLYQEFNEKDRHFDQALLSLTKDLKLETSIYLALTCINQQLNVEISTVATDFISKHRETKKLASLDDFIFRYVLVPHHPSVHCWQFSLAKFIGYCRSHLLKMPLNLLIPHLMKKTWKQLTAKVAPEETKEKPDL